MPEPYSPQKRRCPLMSLAVVLVLMPMSGVAQVYRSVDESGRVTFSDTPPENAVEVEPVEIAPGPSDEQVRESQARAEANQEMLDSLRTTRQEARDRAHEERMQRLQEEALRASIKPPPQQPAEPNRRRWGYYGYGLPTYPGYPTYPVLPHPKPPVHLPEPHKPVAPRRPKTLDSPLYNRSTSPVYR